MKFRSSIIANFGPRSMLQGLVREVRIVEKSTLTPDVVRGSERGTRACISPWALVTESGLRLVDIFSVFNIECSDELEE